LRSRARATDPESATRSAPVLSSPSWRSP
jgi:hypothetical protein